MSCAIIAEMGKRKKATYPAMKLATYENLESQESIFNSTKRLYFDTLAKIIF